MAESQFRPPTTPPMPATQARATITEGLTGSAKVDAERGVIRGVKLIGFESRNGRVYPPKVLKEAVHLYEGSKVNVDHPERDPAQARKYGERFGVIRNAHFVEGKGIYGDFHFNPKHELAGQLVWDAENNPESLGFSHNALLRLGPLQNGKQMIESIVSIRSMDLVADPATTTSLFESEDYREMDPDQAPVADDTSADPKSAMKGAFRSMIMAAVDDESLDMKATMKKIAEIMKAQEKLMGGGSSASTDEPADDESEEGMYKKSEESLKLRTELGELKAQLEQYQAKEKQAALTESIDAALVAEGLDPRNQTHVSELFAKQLRTTESESARLELIKDRAALVGAKPRTGGINRPTYTPSTSTVTESIDAKSFASRLLA